MDKSKVRPPVPQSPNNLRRVVSRAMRGVALATPVAVVAFLAPAHALSQEELVAKLQAAGYTQIRDIKSTAEGISVKATKDGKEKSLVVDSSGQVKERH